MVDHNKKIKLGILGSGSGSNMQAILDAIEAGSLDAQIMLVLSDVPDAFILERAKKAGIPTGLIDSKGYASRFPEDSQIEVGKKLQEAGVDLVCLAGFMRMIKAPFLEMFPDRIINIHPALLPSYPGLMAWKQAIDDGATESGCTVHYVDAGMDTGSVILQKKVPIFPNDTPESLHARIQEQEGIAYPEAIVMCAKNLIEQTP